MKKIRQTTLGLALLALLALGAAGAAAKSGSAERPRAISGVVTCIDLRARTAEVREDGSRRTISVQVPEGMTVKTYLSMQPTLTLERLLPGMHITAIVQ